MKRLPLMIVLFVALLAFFSGCETTTGNGDGNGGGTAGSLEWARNITDGVRDTEFPGTHCYTISAVYVDDEGLIGPDVDIWAMVYTDGTDGLIITVSYSGVTTTAPVDGTELGELPEYSNSQASGWVSTADEAVTESALTYDGRVLTCVGDTQGQYGDVDHITIIQYQSSSGVIAWAVINADTGALLEWEVI